jgi:DNA-binding LacI/PurR family transcriptional regulator
MLMKKAATRNDVAKLAGVSPAVVSYVINKSNYVSEDKRKAVLEAIEKLGYYPNVSARTLKTNKSSQIAFICDNIDSNHWLSKIEDKFYKNKFNVSLRYSKPTNEYLQMIVRSNYEGIFMMTNIYSAEQLNYVAEFGIPIILYKTRNYESLHSRIVTVAPNYADGVEKSVDYLAIKGHKRIALIPPVKYITKGIKGDDYRIKAYRKSMEKHNLPIEEALVCKNTDTVDTILDSIFNMVSSRRECPTGMVICNDYLASQVMQYIKKLGLRIPDDMAIVGTDNSNIASITSPPLTSVDFSKDELADKVTSKLIALINGGSPEDEYLDVRLVIRGSA